jgi:hypothetical protein
VDIVDCGSGSNLGEFERHGKLCVPQAIYESILHLPNVLKSATKKKMYTQDTKGKAGVIAGHPQLKVDLPKLIREAERYNGVGLQSIRSLFKAEGTRALHLWTPERPDGKFYPLSQANPGDIHIVISNYHAYAVVPRGES